MHLTTPMKACLTVLIFVTLSLALHGQNSNADSLIITYQQNNSWLDNVAKLELKDQLKEIKKRILSDTNIYVRQSFTDRIKIEDQYKNEKRVQGQCKPIFIVEGQPVYITNGTDNRNIIALTKFLKADNIKKINILRDQTALAIYGSRAACGVLLISLKNKRTIKKIKNIKWDEI
jgi:TonB-dependent SusC/RagA subfamily outer membrane receptor